ncbi:hypothetical protein N9H93_00445 [Rhizobiaceae bacterium]|nr:hypothetical protein [Rhizobiaceae bacterium]
MSKTIVLAATATCVCAATFAMLQTVARAPVEKALAPIRAVTTESIAVSVMVEGRRTYLAVRLRVPPSLIDASPAPLDVRVQDALLGYLRNVDTSDESALLRQEPLVLSHLRRMLGGDGIDLISIVIAPGGRST